MDIYKVLRDERSSQANIGIRREEFVKLHIYFYKVLQIKERKKRAKNKRGAGKKPTLNTLRKKMFYALYYLKTYPTFDVLGSTFEMNRGTACKWAHYYVDVLLKAFELAGVVPKRKFKSKEEFMEHFPDIKFVIADGTERRKRRPKNAALQKEYYSGKKKLIH